MSLLSFALRESTSIVPSDWRGGSNGTFYFGMGGGNDIDLFVGGGYGKDWYFKAYQYCPPVSAIVNRKSEAFINGVTTIVNRSGKGKGKEVNSEAADKIRNLMARPNPLQSWAQFEAQYYAYYQIYEYCIILPIKPVGYNDPIDTTRLWIIPPMMVDIEESQKIWYIDDGKTIIKKITLSLGGEKTELNWDDLIILKGFSPSLSSLIIPESRFLPLRIPIETVIKGYRSMSNGFDNTPLGIVGNDTKDSMSFIPLSPLEKENLQNELNRFGLGNGQKKFILSNANLTWQPINYPIDTLKLPEHTKMAVTAICDGLGYPYELMSNENGVTFSNKRDAMKMLYQDFIIPVSKSIYEQWNQYFKTEDLNLLIENDYSQLEVLQKDALSKANARKAANEAYLIEFENDLMTVNRWLELNNEDTREDGNVYYSEWIRKNPEVIQARSNNNSNNNNQNGNQ